MNKKYWYKFIFLDNFIRFVIEHIKINKSNQIPTVCMNNILKIYFDRYVVSQIRIIRNCNYRTTHHTKTINLLLILFFIDKLPQVYDMKDFSWFSNLPTFYILKSSKNEDFKNGINVYHSFSTLSVNHNFCIKCFLFIFISRRQRNGKDLRFFMTDKNGY